MTLRMLRAALALACVAVSAGCTTTTGGVARLAPADPDRPDVALLDTGSYPITAEPPAGTASAPGHAEAAESARIAQYVVDPWEVDKARVRPDYMATAPLVVPTNVAAALSNAFPDWRGGDAAGNTAAAHGFIAGFTAGRIGTDPVERSHNVVMRFPDAPSAAAAADELAAIEPPTDMLVLFWTFPTEKGTEQRLTSPWQPGACDSFSANPIHPVHSASSSGGGYYFTRSFTPYGPYVLYQLEISRLRSNGCTTSAQLLTKQQPALDEFVPTDPAKMTELPEDPSGQLWAHSLPAPSSTGLWSDGVWQPSAWLHFEDDPARATALFGSAGVVWVAQRLTTVYQTHNAVGAAKFTEQTIANIAASSDARPTGTGVPGFPGAACFERPAWQRPRDTKIGVVKQVYWHYKCIGSVDRYAFVSVSEEETDAKQQISAQYRILAGQ